MSTDAHLNPTKRPPSIAFPEAQRRVRIVHFSPSQPADLIEQIQAAGFHAEYSVDARGPAIVRELKQDPPHAVVIDLSKRPSHGREIAIWMRGNRTTRLIPIVFANGDEEKVARVREVLPDAAYTITSRLPAALKSALRKRNANPATPKGMMERYKEKPAAAKLGIVAGTSTGLIDPPRDYATVLGKLPENAELIEDPETTPPVTLWFVHDMEGLLAAVRQMRALALKTKLWIAWRKGDRGGVTQYTVREAALGADLVDYKICSIDGRWSAMLFARRKT